MEERIKKLESLVARLEARIKTLEERNSKTTITKSGGSSMAKVVQNISTGKIHRE